MWFSRRHHDAYIGDVKPSPDSHHLDWELVATVRIMTAARPSSIPCPSRNRSCPAGARDRMDTGSNRMNRIYRILGDGGGLLSCASCQSCPKYHPHPDQPVYPVSNPWLPPVSGREVSGPFVAAGSLEELLETRLGLQVLPRWVHAQTAENLDGDQPVGSLIAGLLQGR